MKSKDIAFLMNVAELAASQSTAIRLNVGGVVTDSLGNIIAYGYNGTVSGTDNSCEYKIYTSDETNLGNVYPCFDIERNESFRLKTSDNVIHCEQNLIAHAARRGISINHGKVFLTHSPCIHCTSMLIQAGIEEVYFLEKFRTYDETYSLYKDRIKFIEV